MEHLFNVVCVMGFGFGFLGYVVASVADGALWRWRHRNEEEAAS